MIKKYRFVSPYCLVSQRVRINAEDLVPIVLPIVPMFVGRSAFRSSRRRAPARTRVRGRCVAQCRQQDRDGREPTEPGKLCMKGTVVAASRGVDGETSSLMQAACVEASSSRSQRVQ